MSGGAASEAGLSLRERTRAAVRSDLARTAIALFVAQGFEQVTVAQIAAGAGLSERSFFRYFATKEEAVLAHLIDVGRVALQVLRDRPDDEDPRVAIRASLEPSLQAIRQDSHTSLAIYRLLEQSPSLRATRAEKTDRWCDLLEPEVARRLHPPPRGPYDVRARALVSTALACYDIACATWARSAAARPIEGLLDDALAALR